MPDACKEDFTISAIIEEHWRFLVDQTRLDAFERAINATVKPGDVVLDLGAGTGILGLFACRAGAARVYAIEKGTVIELARQVCRANGFLDRMDFINECSRRVILPEKVDVIVCDPIGRFGFDTGLLDDFCDARDRFLKRGGAHIPAATELFIAAVEQTEVHGNIEFWNQRLAGFDFSPAHTWATNTCHPTSFFPQDLLTEPEAVTSINLAIDRRQPISFQANFETKRAGNLHGFAGWFSALLSPGIAMSNSPLSSEAICRRNLFFPIEHPVAVVPGDSIRIAMHVLPSEDVMVWKVEVWANNNSCGTGKAGLKARFTHSTFHGVFLSSKDLQRTRPHFIPKLSPWGEAHLAAMRLCDGKKTLAQVERDFYQEHHKLFKCPEQADKFVSKIISRYAPQDGQ